MDIGKRLKILIAKKGITAYMLANELNIAKSTISRITSKNAKPNKKTLELLANYFNVDKYWLLTGKEENQNIEQKKKELEIASMRIELAYKNESIKVKDEMINQKKEIIRLKDKILIIQQREIFRLKNKLLTIQEKDGREKKIESTQTIEDLNV